MDQQIQIVLIVVGVVVLSLVMGVVWYSVRQINKLASRRFNAVAPIPVAETRRRSSDCDCGRDPYDCQCPPHERRRCVPARVTAADPTPVAIYGVRDDDDCCNDGTRRLSRRQVQAMVDRANALALEREQAELDELLLDLRREVKSKAI
jgi:hypothetical protein